jgi:hypothetical protein
MAFGLQRMIDDPDIFRTAQLLLQRHGDDAAIRAARRADELEDEGNINASLVWRNVIEAIDDLTRGRKDGEPLN